MGKAIWTTEDSNAFAHLVYDEIKNYTNIQQLTDAYNGRATVKRTPGAVAFRLRSFLDAECFSGERRDHVDSMLYVFYTSQPKKPKAPAVPTQVASTAPAVAYLTYKDEDFQSAAYCNAKFHYVPTWFSQLALRNEVRRVEGTFKNVYGRSIKGWLYSVSDIERYLETHKTIPRKSRRNGKESSYAAVTPSSITNDNRARLLNLFKAGKVDASTALDMLEKL